MEGGGRRTCLASVGANSVASDQASVDVDGLVSVFTGAAVTVDAEGMNAKTRRVARPNGIRLLRLLTRS